MGLLKSCRECEKRQHYLALGKGGCQAKLQAGSDIGRTAVATAVAHELLQVQGLSNSAWCFAKVAVAGLDRS